MANMGYGPGDNLFKFEPLRKFQWELIIAGLDGDEDLIKLALQTCDRPKVENDETTVHHFNDRFKLAGKVRYPDITVTAIDCIPNSASGKFVSELLSDWRRLIFDPLTNEMQPASEYKKNATLIMYDGLYNIKEEFSLIGCWPKSLDFGSVDYKTSDPVEISMVLAVDKAYLKVE